MDILLFENHELTMPPRDLPTDKSALRYELGLQGEWPKVALMCPDGAPATMADVSVDTWDKSKPMPAIHLHQLWSALRLVIRGSRVASLV